MTDYERDLAAGGKPAMSDYERDLAAGGKPVGESSPTRPSDLPLRGMRPEPKPDDAQLVIDQGNFATADRWKHKSPEDRRAVTDRNSPLASDPILQMMVGGAMAAPLAAGAAALAPAGLGTLVGGVVGGGAESAMQGGDPVKGALLGAIPGLPGLARTADTAVGNAALRRVTGNQSFEAAGKMAGAGLGATAGHHAAGIVGAGVGAGIGTKLGGATGRLADRGVGALGQRRMIQMANEASPAGMSAAELDKLSALDIARTVDEGSRSVVPRGAPHRATGYSADNPPIPPRKPLAPLVSEPRSPATRVPNGALGTPFLDEFGVPVTKAGQGGYLPTEAPTGVGKSPLAADVTRDARRFSAETPPAPGPPHVEDMLGADLAKSVRLLDELRAGKITQREAIAQGLPPGVAGRFAR